MINFHPVSLEVLAFGTEHAAQVPSSRFIPSGPHGSLVGALDTSGVPEFWLQDCRPMGQTFCFRHYARPKDLDQILIANSQLWGPARVQEPWYGLKGRITGSGRL